MLKAPQHTQLKKILFHTRTNACIYLKKMKTKTTTNNSQTITNYIDCRTSTESIQITQEQQRSIHVYTVNIESGVSHVYCVVVYFIFVYFVCFENINSKKYFLLILILHLGFFHSFFHSFIHFTLKFQRTVNEYCQLIAELFFDCLRTCVLKGVTVSLTCKVFSRLTWFIAIGTLCVFADVHYEKIRMQTIDFHEIQSSLYYIKKLFFSKFEHTVHIQ